MILHGLLGDFYSSLIAITRYINTRQLISKPSLTTVLEFPFPGVLIHLAISVKEAALITKDDGVTQMQQWEDILRLVKNGCASHRKDILYATEVSPFLSHMSAIKTLT